MRGESGIKGVMAGFVSILVGIVLAPIVYEQATSANVSGTTATVIALVPVFFALGVLIAAIKGLL